MAQQDQCNRQQGGSQQEGFSPSRQQWGQDDARSYGPSGPYAPEQEYERGQASEGWRREQQRGAYGPPDRWASRDDQPGYGRGGYGGYEDQGRDRYGAYGQDRYGSYGQDRYNQDRYNQRNAGSQGQRGLYGQNPYGQVGSYHDPDPMRDERSFGFDPDAYQDRGDWGYRGTSRDQRRYAEDPYQREQFDPDYDQWRQEQLKSLDDDYRQWRSDRFKKFSDEFSSWRSSRSASGNKGSSGGTQTTDQGNKNKNT